jgi:hypothetical protein
MGQSRATELEDLFDEAAGLAARVPAPMQAAAFQAAVGLLHDASRSPRTGLRPTRSATVGAAARPSNGGRTPSGRPGPKAAIEGLLVAGYLSDPRLVGDIRDHLASQGWKYAPKEVATAVLRLLREGRLSRSKGTDGQYEYMGTAAR